ncbi:MAG: hypothetical protein ACJAQS_001436 [Porticoccus sp.]|jgi:hypothetical protein
MDIILKLPTILLVNILFFGQASAQSLAPPLDYVSPIMLSNNNLANGAVAFRGAFENASWQGDLFAYTIAADGSITKTPTWSANQQFAEAETANPNTYWASRNIVFGATPILFKWANLTPDQQLVEGLTEGVVNFIRGDRTQESNGWRRRNSLLGAIIRSNPVYVGAPNANINTSAYQTFATANANRTPLVYVGANDGMLHGFNAETGKEAWAYIPSMLLSSLPNLAVNPYKSNYYVDGSLNVGDVEFSNGTWNTVLVGSLGAGGKGLFAVDVTDPGSQNAPGQKVLWELNDGDMGYVFGPTSIVKLNDGSWYAVNGNGFNSGSSKAVLYITNVKTGTIKEKVTISNNNLGLSAPAFVDFNGDGKADLAYAGDLQGDMWRIDLTNMAAITTAKVFDGNANQPISMAPKVAKHPLGGFWLQFGTGRSYDATDINDKIQAIVGIRDNGLTFNAIKPADLLKRTLSAPITYIDQNNQVTDRVVRTIVDASVNISTQKGWMIVLPAGEKLLTSPQLRDGRLRASITKTNEDPSLNENWILEATYDQGSSNLTGVYDLNGDASINALDRVDGNNDGDMLDREDIPMALKRDNGLLSQATIAQVNKYRDMLFYNTNKPLSAPFIDSPDVGCIGSCGGLEGGHMDVDTDLVWGDKTSSHAHEYDVKTGLTYIDYFNIKEGLNNLVTNKKFIILIANADLSPATEIIMGKDSEGKDIQHNAVEYQKLIHQKLAAWDGSSDLTDQKGNSLIHTTTSLKDSSGSLRIQFDSRAIANSGLIPTNTGCVKENRSDNNRWRNGALTMHLVDSDNFTFPGKVEVQDPTDLVDAMYIKGEQIELTGFGGLLAKKNGFVFESTVFWHYEGKSCYGDAGYEEEVRKIKFVNLLVQDGVKEKDAEKINGTDSCVSNKGKILLEEERCNVILELLNTDLYHVKNNDGDGDGDSGGGGGTIDDAAEALIRRDIDDGNISGNKPLKAGRASWIDMLTK